MKNAILLSTVIFCFFLACKKTDFRSGGVNNSMVKIAVQKWQEGFSKTASINEIKLVDSIVKCLDYAMATKISLNDGDLYLVEISTIKNSSGKVNTLGIALRDGLFSFEGIFQAVNLVRIENFYQKGTLSVNDSILVLNLKKYPLYGWTKRANGIVVKLVGKSLPKGVLPTAENLGNNGLSKRVDYVQDPNAEPCTDHFVIYYDGAGQIIDMVQLASTGNCSTNDGSQGGGTNSAPPDGCATAQAAAATTFSNNDAQFAAAKTNIVNAFNNDGNEHSVRFGKDANGNVISSSMSTGNGTSATSSSVTNAFADLHNHPGNLPPSAGDVYTLMQLYQGNNKYATRYVVTPNGTEYALAVTDQTALSNFLKSYPSLHVPGYSPDFPDSLLTIYNSIYQDNKFQVGDQVANEMAMAYILDSFNAGVAMLKKDSNGNFRKLGTAATTSGGSTTYSQATCN